MGSLKPAHKGYRYQDISAAYFLVRSIVEKYESVTIDRKQVDDDRVDDLEINILGQRIRRQFKSSENPARAISDSDFLKKDSTLRIDRLVLTHALRKSEVKEYRLCATWVPPAIDDGLHEILIEADIDSTFPETAPQCYQLNAEKIWPADERPIWPILQSDAIFGRDDFIDFCDRFFIELQLPIASTDILIPGPLENSLLNLLEQQIGIGRYPNHGRTVADVAALALSLANLGRTQEATYTPEVILKKLEIRTDFGRVSQSFPLDSKRFHDRPSFRKFLYEKILQGGTHIVVAGPGSGKSWELTKLGEELKQNGILVARHYCYLEPGDEFIERRVTSDVFFGNIIGELQDSLEPFNIHSNRYSADLTALEDLIKSAQHIDKKIVLIIDGLDHIARVKSSSRFLSNDETDIVEKLATINSFPNVSIVVGTQSGSHLQPLIDNRNPTEHRLPIWSQEDIIGLVTLCDVNFSTLNKFNINLDDVNDIQINLAEKCGGNPLYARYLSTGLIVGVKAGAIDNPLYWLDGNPHIGGDIAVYYRHLYNNIITQAQAIADILGTIDFSISELDLKDMLPAIISSWIPQAMVALAPILTISTGQGGMRIFHESFRRFMIDELRSQGRSIGVVTEPVIEWLRLRGFLKDAKSYRFFLPLLRRAERDHEILNYIDANFISNSVSHGHPVAAIQKNLAIAADVAGNVRNWPVLVRISELRRSLSTCFDIGQNSWQEYWETYAHIFGAVALSERLLFDGSPTLSNEEGLSACLLIDDMGAIAPWREYLESPTDEVGDDSYSDEKNGLTQNELLSIATIQGRFCIGQGWRMLRKFYNHLVAAGLSERSIFIRAISARLTRLGCESFLSKLATRSDANFSFKKRFDTDVGFSIRLGIADELYRRKDIESSRQIAEMALASARTMSMIIDCLDFGVLFDESISITPSTPLDEYFESANEVQEWVSAVRLLAKTSYGSSILSSELNRLQGEGWYRCWLRYIVALAQADAQKNKQQAYDINSAFSALSQDVRPFAGTPRPCDLYKLHSTIKESIALGLKLLRTMDEWDHAIAELIKVNEGTSSSFDREDGGPISIGTIIELLLPYANDPIAGSKILTAIQEQVAICDEMGTYYAVHATYTMYLARGQIARGLKNEALSSWERAGVFLTSYGYRKDTTLFDLIETVPVLLAEDNEGALIALEKLQPLVASVLRHTDGRSTKRAPNAWFKNLLKIDAPRAIELLGRTILEDGGVESWITVDALEDVAEFLVGKADPLLIDAIWETIRFKIEYDNAGPIITKPRLVPIRSLFQNHTNLASQRLARLAAEVVNDANNRNAEAAGLVQAVADEHNQKLSCFSSATSKGILSETSKPASLNKRLNFNIKPIVFPAKCSYVELLSIMRNISEFKFEDNSTAFKYITQYLSYKLQELVEDGGETDALRLLYFYARDIKVPLSTELHPLGDLALCLDHAKLTSLSVVAYALAYMFSRGRGGWQILGDSEHSTALQRAIELDKDLALQAVADEISHRLRHLDYGSGISHQIIERTAQWGDQTSAIDSWLEAFEVISRRLSLSRGSHWFAPLNLIESVSWDLNESLVALLLVRVHEPRYTRKISALSGILRAIRYRPESIIKPFQWWMSRDNPTSSIILVLHLLYLEEKPPHVISVGSLEVLQRIAQSEMWAAAQIARNLLVRAKLIVPNQYFPIVGKRRAIKVSKQEVEFTCAFDESGIIPYLERIWPDFPLNVTEKLRELLKQNVNVERIRERLKLSFGKEGKAHPPAQILFWQQELLISMLHTELSGIKEYLWRSGNWLSDIEQNLMKLAQPNLRTHLSVFCSRVSRPNWEMPSDLTDGVYSLEAVKDDPKYEGWARLGIFEEQYMPGQHSFSRPIKRVRLFAGAVIKPDQASVTGNFFPFLNGNLSTWWAASGARKFSNEGLHSSLINLGQVHDWLAETQLLTPPNIFHEILNPELPEMGEPLIWRDKIGQEILVLRHWRIASDQFHVETNRVIGQDIIIRPDFIPILERFYNGSIFELRHVSIRVVESTER